ncbi:MAG: phosphatase [Cyclobacteriaceae bacterium]|nr:phosphatase [Cyclobacteriaceae bacterium]UYN86571.1 MAG: phosphatase [Cyclobacteriaceae bacterium]
MKKFILLTGLFILAISGYTQSRPVKNLTPVRGHYRQLQQFSPAPAKKDAEVDMQKFPFDAQAAERRLSLKPHYLNDNINFSIPDPPANSSPQTRAELNYLLNLQQQRTHDQVRAALYMAGVYYNPRAVPTDSLYSQFRKNLFHIGRSIGTWFSPESLPITADFIAHVWQDASYYSWKYKYQFLRVRPYVLEPRLQNLEETNWAAYPSGHAANSYVNAFIYAALAPEFKDVFLKDAYDMAHSREIIGVHYPSDSEASRVLARQIVNELFRNEKFMNDFKKVKQEWATNAKEKFEKPDPGKSKPSVKKEGCAKTCE